MKKIILGVTFAALVIVSFLAGAYAFNVIELVFPPVLSDSFQNNHFAQHWMTNGDNVGMRYLWFFNTTKTTYIDVWDDGTVTINGKGICLEDGESTTGNKC